MASAFAHAMSVLFVAGSLLIVHGAPAGGALTPPHRAEESFVANRADIDEMIKQGAKVHEDGVVEHVEVVHRTTSLHNVTAEYVKTTCRNNENCGGSGQPTCTGCCWMSSCTYDSFTKRYKDCNDCTCNYYCM